MAIAKDQSMAVGGIFAKALFEAADRAGQLDEVFEQFHDFVAYMDGEGDFAAFMTALTVDDEVRRATLDKLFRGRMNDLLLNALQVLNDRGRSDVVRAAYRQIELLVEKRRNQKEIEVYVSSPLPDDQREQLKGMLTERLGKEAILNVHVDAELIGGMIVQIDDRRLDMSVKHQSVLLRRRLLDRAGAEIHGRKVYFTDSASPA